MTKRTVTHYPEEFKKTSAQFAVESKEKVDTVAQDLGVHPTTLRGWVKKYYPHMLPARQTTPAEDPEAEIKRLKKALAEKEKECDILKKASAYFAKHLS